MTDPKTSAATYKAIATCDMVQEILIAALAHPACSSPYAKGQAYANWLAVSLFNDARITITLDPPAS